MPETVSALFVVPEVELVIEPAEAITNELKVTVPAYCKSNMPEEPIFTAPPEDPPKALPLVTIILDEAPMNVPPEYELLPDSVSAPEPF